jgi:hypothetical protein
MQALVKCVRRRGVFSSQSIDQDQHRQQASAVSIISTQMAEASLRNLRCFLNMTRPNKTAGRAIVNIQSPRFQAKCYS